ncbi:hypothetical protein LINPERHAP1_LOCUS8148, partial [Linum perenne]
FREGECEVTPGSRPAANAYSYTPPGSPTRAKALAPYKKRSEP